MDVWPRDPDADMCPREASGMSTDDCMDHQVQRSAIGEACRFVAPRRTINQGDHHDQQAKKEGKQESKQAGGVCGGAPDYDGKIKEAAHLCAKPRARLAF